jgi:large subunit ribosomal protein L25
MKQIELEVTERKILGKKVRFLRHQGITPLHLFGHGIESASLQCATTNLQRVLAEAGQTRLIRLKLNNEKGPRNVVVRGVQKEPLTGETLHVDFYEVRMGEQVKMEIPIILVGEAPTLRSKENTLVQELNSLAIECLPASIPNNVELNVTSITEPDQVQRVKDIELNERITVLSDPEQVVTRISTRPIERIDEAAAIEEEEAEAIAEETPEEE